MMRKRSALRQASLALGIFAAVWLMLSSGFVAQDVSRCTIRVRSGESIQAAVDQAPDNAVICLSPGTYIENLIIGKNLTLSGEGEEPTQVRVTGAAEGHPVIQVGSEQEIEVKIENLAVSEAKGSSGDGIQIAGGVRVMIVNVCISENSWCGVSVSGEARLTLTDSSVSQNYVSGLSVEDAAHVEVLDSRFESNKAFGVIAVSGDAQLVGTNNVFHGNGADLGGFASAGLRTPLAPQTDSKQLSVPEEVSTLQEAIDAIAPGGSITVSPGTFVGGITIWKPVAIHGSGPKRTTLVAPPERDVVVSILAEAQHVTLEGVTVAESGGQGLAIYGRDVNITNAHVADNDRWGLWAGGAASVSLQDSIVSSNWVGVFVESSAQVGVVGCTVEGNATGLAVGGSAVAILQDSTISGNQDGLWAASSAQLSLQECTVSGNSDDGLQVSGSAQLTMADSVVSGNGWDGLDASGSPHVTLTDCSISDNGYQGLGARESTEMDIRNSTISGNEHGCQFSDSALVTIMDSTIRDSVYDGIGVSDTAQLSLAGSTISDSEYDGLQVSGAAVVAIRKCQFLNNEGFGIVALSSESKLSGTRNVFHGNGADLGGFAPASLRTPLVPQSDRTQLDVPKDYPTLQEAIDAIIPGGSITVGAGTLVAGSTIWKSVVIRGSGPDETTLRGLPGAKAVVSVLAEAEGVHLEGLKIAGSERDGLMIHGQGVTLHDIEVSGNRWDGLEVWGTAAVTARDCTMSGNADGVDVRDSATLVLEDSTILNNREAGLYTADSANVTLVDTMISGSTYGLMAGGSAQVIAQGLAVSDSGFDGVCAGDSVQLTLIDCAISNCGSEGVDVSDAAQVTVKGCRVFDNGLDGLSSTNTGQLNVAACLISDNGGSGVKAKGEAAVHIQNCRIQGNARYGVSAYLPDCLEDYYWFEVQFSGEVTGYGNTIPGPDEPDGNQAGSVCPGSLSFLQEGAAQSEEGRATTSQATEADLEDLVAGSNQLAVDLYQALRREGGNLFFSPYSISAALAMTYAGARESTEAQMAQALHFTLGQESLHPAFSALALDLAGLNGSPAAGGRFQLDIANALWGQSGWPFLPEFLNVLAENYGAGIQLLDFAQDPEDARLTINDWVYRQTDERIADLLPSGAIDSLTELLLTNAIYFSAAWEFCFNPDFTIDEAVFTRLDGREVAAPIMQQMSPFRYAEGPTYQAVELRYLDGEVSMVAFLPRPTMFEAFASALDAERVEQIMNRLTTPISVHLAMPKFSFESGFHLKDPLTSLGMPDAFTGAADFSGMDGTRELFLGEVFHKAFISVDENGTEAAAGTAAGMYRMRTPEVFLNRPFIFLIVHKGTRTILFIGQLMDPSEG